MFSPSKLHSPHGRTDIWKAQELERTGVFPSCKMLLSISDAQNLTYQVFPKKMFCYNRQIFSKSLEMKNSVKARKQYISP